MRLTLRERRYCETVTTSDASNAPRPEAVIFIGIQATGKSTFCRERFFRSHVRVNLDMLGTRHRETRLIETCLATGISFVVDNTNPSAADRARYLAPARAAGFAITGYYFASQVAAARARNAARAPDEQVPDLGLLGAAGRLERPRLAEGFDALYYVRIADSGFAVEPWQGDAP
ncbi:MAG: AAA family ATPase [Deltaproteobacteria bacterium]|nr:AAA family ATPase [Deltaproteobacteria bacterium]